MKLLQLALLPLACLYLTGALLVMGVFALGAAAVCACLPDEPDQPERNFPDGFSA